jgi:hypothetical protein
MSYEKDIYGNVIGTGGDDTSLQNEKMAGYPGYNLFDKQKEKSLLTPEQVQQRSGVNVGVPNVPKGAVSVVPSGVPVGNPQIVRQPAAVSGGNANFVGNKAPRYAPITSTEQLAAAMGYTSPQEEERLRKASVTNQRIMAIGDALRHIGNIANTVRYAPSQQFNSPVTDEIARYERGKALRDRANAALLTYQQQKAAQERAERKLDAQIKKQEDDAARNDRIADARISRYNAQNSKDKASQAYWETRARLQEEGWPLEKAIKEARKAQIDAQTELAKVKTANGGSVPRSSTRSSRSVSGGRGKGTDEWDRTTTVTVNRDKNGK